MCYGVGGDPYESYDPLGNSNNKRVSILNNNLGILLIIVKRHKCTTVCTTPLKTTLNHLNHLSQIPSRIHFESHTESFY